MSWLDEYRKKQKMLELERALYPNTTAPSELVRRRWDLKEATEPFPFDDSNLLPSGLVVPDDAYRFSKPPLEDQRAIVDATSANRMHNDLFQPRPMGGMGGPPPKGNMDYHPHAKYYDETRKAQEQALKQQEQAIAQRIQSKRVPPLDDPKTPIKTGGNKQGKKKWDGKPHEGNRWKPDFSLNEYGLPRGLLGARDEQGRQTHRGLFGGISNWAKDFFNDPSRVALTQAGLTALDPNSYYDAQGFASGLGGLNRALAAGVNTYQTALNRPMRYSTDAFGRVLDKFTGKFMRPAGQTGSVTSIPLSAGESFVLSKLREKYPNRKFTAFDVKFNRNLPTKDVSDAWMEWRRASATVLNPATTYAQKLSDAMAKEHVQQITDLRNSASSSESSNIELENQLRILKNAEQNPEQAKVFGPFAEERQWFRNFASLLGYDGFDDTINTYQMFAKSSMTQLLNQLKEQKGPQTEGDALRAMKTLPRPDNMALSNKYILLTRKVINDRAIAKHRFMVEYMQRPEALTKGLQGFDEAWTKSIPANYSTFELMLQTDPNILNDLLKGGVFSASTINEILLANKKAKARRDKLIAKAQAQ